MPHREETRYKLERVDKDIFLSFNLDVNDVLHVRMNLKTARKFAYEILGMISDGGTNDIDVREVMKNG